ncbi:MAG: GGDEF domain-containing protein [Pseudomonadota bacterium]
MSRDHRRTASPHGIQRLQLDEWLILLLAVAGIIGIGPFIAVRLLAGNYAVAALNTALVGVLVVIAWLVYRYRAVRTGKAGLALLCIIGVIATMYLRGAGQILWAYPALIAMFYLLRPLEALLVSVVAIGAVSPVLIAGDASNEVSVTLASMAVTLALSAAFSTMTMEHRRQLREATLVDPLTKTGNRRAFTETLDTIIDDDEIAISLLMLDIDHFKRINDRHGHAIGDIVLQRVARSIETTMRASDRLYRIGGEEYVVLATGSGLNLARRLGEAVRVAVSDLVIEGAASEPPFSVTVSLGIAERLPGEHPDAWYRRVDDALYEAKRSGRNQICLADKTASLSGPCTYTAPPTAA